MLPVFCLDPHFADPNTVGAVRYHFLLDALADLDASLRKHRSRLYVLRGKPAERLPELWKATEASLISWEFDSEPYAQKRDAELARMAREDGLEVLVEHSHTLHPLDKYVAKASGKSNLPKTYEAFRKLLAQLGSVPRPVEAPGGDLPFAAEVDEQAAALAMDSVPKATDLGYPEPSVAPEAAPKVGDAAAGVFVRLYPGGETEGLRRMREHLARETYIRSFEKPKTSPAALKPSTTVLSPYLKFGCVSVRTFFHGLAKVYKGHSHAQPPVSLHGQLIFREFFYLCSYTTENYGQMVGNAMCRQIDWDADEDKLRAWEEGRTGYPWIDALMRQLRREGWMHHLGRHSVACFLTRGDLWQSWEAGLRVFDKYLIDADWALNVSNWLWLSCSAFFHQYHRCYSPIAFAKKWDTKDGAFIRKYVPELARMPDKYIFEPWKAPQAAQHKAGCVIGKDYPKPIVADHTAVSKANMDRMARAFQRNKEGGESKKHAADGDDAAAAKRARKED